MDKLEVVRGDITNISIDAIVNAANSSLMGGGGVDGAIHRAGGPAILEECKKIVARQGGCKTGEAVITTGGKLPAKFVIHTVGPVWNGGHNNEATLLANCYKNSLQVAMDNGCKTIAFPNISTGIFRFPKKEAAKIAVDSVRKFINETSDVVDDEKHQQRRRIEKVLFVCFDEENFELVKTEISTQSPD